MRLELWLDSQTLCSWHRELADSLNERVGMTAQVRLIESTRPQPAPWPAHLLRLERGLLGVEAPRTTALRDVDFADLAVVADADLVIDLAGVARGEEPGKTWQLTFDGTPGQQAAVDSLLSGRLPVVAVEDATDAQPISGGRPGSENPSVFGAALDDLLAGCSTLIHAALDAAAARPPQLPPLAIPTPGAVTRRAVSEIASSAAYRGYRTAFRNPHWRVGWRFVDGPDVMDLRGHPESGWHDLPDDGQHFYADPFPIVANGQTYLFVEDFDHRLGRGVISVVPFNEFGPVGVPRPVLTASTHLSYPYVFASDGEYWMIPENTSSASVQLYRATDFPYGWEYVATMLKDVVASDATVFQHAGRWWMLATVRNGGSYSDTLHAWHTDSLTGPWTGHRSNPLVVDIAAARPAGRVVSRDGSLVRPVQDCEAGYGSALGLYEITRLDESGYAQQQVARITPGPLWSGRRLHTLNRAGRLECIDGSRMAPRWRGRRRAI